MTASVADLIGKSNEPVHKHYHSSWLNWKPTSSAEDEQMVSSVMGEVGLSMRPQGQAELPRKATGLPSSLEALSATPEGPEAPVAHIASTEEEPHRDVKALNDYFGSSQTVSLTSVPPETPMHNHISQTDSLVNKLLGTVAGLTTGRNREILLRRKAHLAGTSSDADSAVDAPQSVTVQPIVNVPHRVEVHSVVDKNTKLAEAYWAKRQHMQARNVQATQAVHDDDDDLSGYDTNVSNPQAKSQAQEQVAAAEAKLASKIKAHRIAQSRLEDERDEHLVQRIDTNLLSATKSGRYGLSSWLAKSDKTTPAPAKKSTGNKYMDFLYTEGLFS